MNVDRKVIFVTYGNQAYYKSLERIRSEAEATGEFDKILVYTDKDLPDHIKQHPLMRYKRGGGYWFWKPWVISQALKFASDNDIVVYSDCGNTVYPHKQWHKLFKKLDNHDAVLFYNGGRMECWSSSTMMRHFNLSTKWGGRQISNHKQFYAFY